MLDMRTALASLHIVVIVTLFLQVAKLIDFE